MRSEKPKKNLSKAKNGQSESIEANASEPVSLFVNSAVSGSTAINFLAHDPALAESEAAAIFEACKRTKKE